MNYKLFALTFIAFLSVLSFANALSMTVSNDLSMSQNATLNFVSGENFNQTITLSPTSPYTDSSGVVYSFPASFDLNMSQSRQIVLNASSIPSGLKFGKYSFTLNANGVDKLNASNTSSATGTITFDKTFCNSGTVGNNVTITSVTLRDNAQGSDDTSWTLLDNVEVRVRVENTGDDTIRGINVALGLFDSNGVNHAGDLIFSSSNDDKISIGSIKSGNDATATFDFQVPADMNSGNYRLAVKAYSSTQGENVLCADTSSDLDSNIFQTVSIDTQSSQSKYIAFDNVQTTPTEVTCGDTLSLSATAYNIGDQDEDRVRINVNSNALNWTDSTELTNGLSMGESSPVTFTTQIPAGTKDGLYLVNLFADYEYNNGIYTQRSSDYTTAQVKVIGCNVAQPTSGLAGISAVLGSSVVAGQPLSVTSTITNLGSSQNTYTIDASGYDSWATLTSQSDRAIVLNPGQSKQVTFQFAVNSAVSGQQTFSVNARTASTVDSRSVAVEIPASGFSLGGNSTIWIIAGINVVLLIIIIIVAVRLANR